MAYLVHDERMKKTFTWIHRNNVLRVHFMNRSHIVYGNIRIIVHSSNAILKDLYIILDRKIYSTITAFHSWRTCLSYSSFGVI